MKKIIFFAIMLISLSSCGMILQMPIGNPAKIEKMPAGFQGTGKVWRVISPNAHIIYEGTNRVEYCVAYKGKTFHCTLPRLRHNDIPRDLGQTINRPIFFQNAEIKYNDMAWYIEGQYGRNVIILKNGSYVVVSQIIYSDWQPQRYRVRDFVNWHY